VPYRGQYPLDDLNARMRALAAPHTLTYPAYWLGREVGQDVPDASGTGGRVRQSDGRQGLLALGPPIPLGAGHYEIAERVRLDRPAHGTVEAIEIRAGGRVLAHRDVDAVECGRPGEWATVRVGVDLDAPITKDVEWRIAVAPDVRLSVDAVSLPVTYDRLEVLDLEDRLNTFDTHASTFDSHPNARAHGEIASALAQWVLSKAPATR